MQPLYCLITSIAVVKSRGQHVLQKCEASERREDEYILQTFGMGAKAALEGCMRHRQGSPGLFLTSRERPYLGCPGCALPQS